MKFLSAHEDFVRNTLSRLSGVLDRLTFTARVRMKEGEHWGLARVHGRDAAQKALGEAHRDLTSTTLKTPLIELSTEYDQTVDPREVKPGAELAAPESPHPSGKHLRWILRVLAAASRRSRASSDQASSQ